MMHLPIELHLALEHELSITSVQRLTRLSSGISRRYRTSGSGDSLNLSGEEVEAYAVYRMPATYGAVYGALEQVIAVLPDWEPLSLLDVGAGPGTVMWAASDIFPKIDEINLFERESSMISLGKRIAHHSICYGVQSAKWLQQDLTLDWEIAPHDLVTASYVLGELNEDDREEFIAKLWQSTNDVLLIVEPGTPQGFARLRTVRKQLIEEGAIVIAPCPHNSSCAISGEDWCHFSQRIDRTSIHRKVKGGHLSYEDEKFSFLAAARTPGKAVFGRILRHPQIRKGHVIFDICSSAGISQQIVSRKQQEQYKTAKKLRWGSILEQPDDQA